MATMSSISCRNENFRSHWFVVQEDITVENFFTTLGRDERFYCTIVDGEIIEEDSDLVLEEGSEIRLIPRI